jgi:hypothetical protein
VVHLVDLEAALVDEARGHVAPLFPPQHDQQARALGRDRQQAIGIVEHDVELVGLVAALSEMASETRRGRMRSVRSVPSRVTRQSGMLVRALAICAGVPRRDHRPAEGQWQSRSAAGGHRPGVALVDRLDHEAAEDKPAAIEQGQRLALIGHFAQLVERDAAIGDLGIDRAREADFLVPCPQKLHRIARAHAGRAGKAPVGLALQFVVGERGDLEEEQPRAIRCIAGPPYPSPNPRPRRSRSMSSMALRTSRAMSGAGAVPR